MDGIIHKIDLVLCQVFLHKVVESSLLFANAFKCSSGTVMYEAEIRIEHHIALFILH